eukprot:PITA_15611
MGSKIKEEAVKSLIRSEYPDILLIQETKMEDKAFLHIGKNLWKKSEGQAVSARGASGGLGTLWNPSKLTRVKEIANTHWLFSKLKHVDTDETLCLFNVYIPVNAREKKNCWDSIRELAETEDLANIIIVGDLNLTLSTAEKRGGSIEKLRRVKSALKVWAKSLPNPTAERKKLQEQLETHQLNSENEEITKEILETEAEIQQKLLKASLAEGEYWRIKSRRLWLKASDRNTSFFHKQAQARKNSNSITEIKEENSIHRGTQSIKTVAFQHFKKLYSEKEEQAQIPLTINEVPKRISNRKNQFLEAEVTNNEIKAALFYMESDKAPGPDGFTARFLQHCWQIIEKDLCRMVRKSQNCQKIGGSTNSAFLALIPKERGANSFSRFRPISLCNIGYKLITKVIANRLKTIPPDIILENQGGFIQ